LNTARKYNHAAEMIHPISASPSAKYIGPLQPHPARQ
jgi:hypothetical protein